MRPKVLQLGNIENAPEEWNRLCEVVDIVPCTSNDREEFKEDCKTKYAGVIAIYRTFSSSAVTGPLDADLIAHLPPSLGFIAHNGAGYDTISTDACTSHGIQLSNTPTAVDDATADTNAFLILGALRNFNNSMACLRRGDWREGIALGHDPQGKTLGILGMGGIGRALKQRCDAFGMRTIYHNRTRLSAHLECGAEYVSFDALLRDSDVLSLNLPLNGATRHIIDEVAFSKMKDGVVVVNTARGAVIDEAALVTALESGKVGCAGLDVYEEEPKIDPGLLANDNCILLPHMGTYSHETLMKMEERTIANVRSAVLDGKLLDLVPEQRH